MNICDKPSNKVMMKKKPKQMKMIKVNWNDAYHGDSVELKIIENPVNQINL